MYSPHSLSIVSSLSYCLSTYSVLSASHQVNHPKILLSPGVWYWSTMNVYYYSYTLFLLVLQMCTTQGILKSCFT